MFFGCTTPPDSKETELGGSDEEAFPLAGKNRRVILVPYHALYLFISDVAWEPQ